jgi:hypothetical protein
MDIVKSRIAWTTKITIPRFRDPDETIAAESRKGMSIARLIDEFPREYKGSIIHDGNTACNPGLEEIIDLIFGLGTPTQYAHAACYIGIGDGNGSSITPAVTDETLTATTNKTYVIADATFPSRTLRTVSIRATFGPGVAVHGWKEIAIRNASSEASGKQLLHAVYEKTTKNAVDTYVPLIEMTWAPA